MAHVYKLTACWDARARTLDEYGADLAKLREVLGWLDERFQSWNTEDDGPSRKLVTPEEFSDYLRAHPETWQHGSMTYHAWQAFFSNRRGAGEAVSFIAKVGIQEPSTVIWFPNLFELSLVGPGRPDSFSNVATVERLLGLVVLVFRPRWVSFGPAESAAGFREQLDGLPPPAWMLYVADAEGVASQEATHWTLARLGDGVLARTRMDWPSPKVREDVEAMSVMTRALVDTGIVKPAVVLSPD